MSHSKQPESRRQNYRQSDEDFFTSAALSKRHSGQFLRMDTPCLASFDDAAHGSVAKLKNRPLYEQLYMETWTHVANRLQRTKQKNELKNQNELELV